MSRVLKIIVNVILICAIATAAALLIPSVLDVPMVVVDDVNMDTNLPAGSVTYAREKDSSQVEAGDRLVISQDSSRYVYEVQSVSGDTCTVEETGGDGGTQEITLPSRVDEVLVTIPFIGYASMALRSTEGLIIVGLAVVFVIILFILAEIWKKDEDDEEEDQDAQEYEDEDEEEEEAPAMSRREARRQAKAERKRAKKAAKASAEDEDEEEDDIRIAEPVKKKRQPVPEARREPEKLEHPGDLFAETESSMASAIADMMEQDQREADTDMEDDLEDWKPAMPVRTKEELLKKAHADGDEPEVRDDEVSGVTLIDYSDIL